MDQQGLYDIYSFSHVPWFKQSWFFYTLIGIGILIALVMLLFVFYVIRTSRRKTIWQHAINQLENTKFEDQKRSIRECTSILKRYLIKRFGPMNAGLTDDELLNALDGSNDPALLIAKKDIRNIVEMAHVVKFANSRADEVDTKQLAQSCIAIIKQTIPTDTIQ